MSVVSWQSSFVVLLLCSVALSGCTEESVDALDVELPQDAVVSEDGRDLRTDLTVDDDAPRPAWNIGDRFGHHVFFGREDTEGTHIDVVVVGETSNDWIVATTDDEVARYEAMFDVPIVGALAKRDLDTTAFGGDWQVYDFPMRHNKTWTGTLTVDAGWDFDLTYTATYQAEFATEQGKRPGYLVTGVDADGRTVVETDYVPAVGWYTRFTVWDVDSPEPDDFVFQSLSMGTGHDWTGEYVSYEARELMNVVTDVNPGSAGAPADVQAFNVPEGLTLLGGIFYSYAAGGASTLRLLDGEGEVRVEQTSTHAPEGADPEAWSGAGDGGLYFMSANPGDWHLNWDGAAVASGYGALVWGLTATTGVLAAEAPA